MFTNSWYCLSFSLKLRYYSIIVVLICIFPNNYWSWEPFHMPLWPFEHFLGVKCLWKSFTNFNEIFFFLLICRRLWCILTSLCWIYLLKNQSCGLSFLSLNNVFWWTKFPNFNEIQYTQPRDRTQASCIAGRFSYPHEPPGKLYFIGKPYKMWSRNQFFSPMCPSLVSLCTNRRVWF